MMLDVINLFGTENIKNICLPSGNSTIASQKPLFFYLTLLSRKYKRDSL